MANHVAKVTELVGTSEDSVDDAIKTAVKRAGKTLRNMRWLEVSQIRADIKEGKVDHFQVMLKVGFSLDD
jgi:flavin-binding protein dodecin